MKEQEYTRASVSTHRVKRVLAHNTWQREEIIGGAEINIEVRRKPSVFMNKICSSHSTDHGRGGASSSVNWPVDS